MRSSWLNLNGEWQFEFDDDDLGLKERWYEKGAFGKTIIVPYAYQTKLSQINIQDIHEIVWYSKEVNFEPDMLKDRIIIHFGAVDYKADVWVNGQHIITHEGGHSSFKADITNAIKRDETNLVVIRVQDYTYDLELPRGKQYWKNTSESIFYTRTTGIWQTVWIESVAETYLEKVWITPDLDRKMVRFEFEVEGTQEAELNLQISLRGKTLAEDRIKIINNRAKREIWLDQQLTLDWNHQESWAWSPENPVLFDVKFTIFIDGRAADDISSYFAMRKVSIQNGKFMLNNYPYYQKMLLDQGYWEESLLTAPTDEHFVTDIKLCKKMGFNGVRKHQKIEDPRFLYWADKLGLLVWGESASAYVYSRKYASRMVKEWIEMIERDYNHPCIIAWTPLNESWGIDGVMNNEEEQAHSASMYYLTKSLDQTRPVISNDGWNHTKSDLLTIHDYESDKEVLKQRYSTKESILGSTPARRTLYAQGWKYSDEPIIVSEFGGISFRSNDAKGWGYSSAQSEEDFIERYYKVISAMLESPDVQGFVYTQLSDVEQEMNGLLTYDRKPKVSPEVIKKINDGVWKTKKLG